MNQISARCRHPTQQAEGEHPDTNGQTVLIGREGVAVERGAAGGPRHPEPKHRAAVTLQERGEILGPQRWLLQPFHPGITEQVDSRRRHQACELGIVVHRRRNAAVMNAGLAAMAPAEGVHGVLNPAGQTVMDGRIKATHRTQQPHVVGDHIEGLPPLDPTEAHHHRMERIQAAADRLLQAAHHPRRDPDRIGALVRTGAMAALAEYLDLQFAGGGGEAAAANPHGSGRDAGKHMHAEQGLHPLHGPISTHPGGSLGRFLGGLEQKPHPGSEALAPGGQQGRDPKAHRCMDVMTAGMHQALVGGGPGQGGALLDRQGIHVDPQGNDRTLLRTQLRHDTGAADRFAHLPPHTAQLAGHQGRRLVFMATELRMAVDMATQLDQIREQVPQLVLQDQPVGTVSLARKRLQQKFRIVT